MYQTLKIPRRLWYVVNGTVLIARSVSPFPWSALGQPVNWLTLLESYPGFGIRQFRRWLLIGISRFNTRHQRWLESLKRRLSALRSVLVFYSNEYSTRFENLHVREREYEHEHERERERGASAARVRARARARARARSMSEPFGTGGIFLFSPVPFFRCQPMIGEVG